MSGYEINFLPSSFSTFDDVSDVKMTEELYFNLEKTNIVMSKDLQTIEGGIGLNIYFYRVP